MHSRTSELNSTGKRCDGSSSAPLTRFQHLFDGVQQALGIEQHQLVELPPLRFSDFESLQSLKVEPDGRDRRLQFMRDCVDETVMLLVAANFTDKKNGIEDKAGDDSAKKNDARKTLMPWRQLRMIQPLPTANATAARQTPSVRKK